MSKLTILSKGETQTKSLSLMIFIWVEYYLHKFSSNNNFLAVLLATVNASHHPYVIFDRHKVASKKR